MEARAIEIGFRHLAAPVRQCFGPELVVLDGAEFPTGGNVIVGASEYPAWSVTGPTGFDFSYVVPEEQRQSFNANAWHGVPVKLYRVWETSPGVWVEQLKWRFVGVVVDARYTPMNGRMDATATPWSLTRQAAPQAPSWSNQEQLDLTDGADTLLRWTRAARRLEVPVEEA